MSNEYTRQRQGRDFFTHLTNAEMSAEGIDSDERRDFLTRIERFKEESERNAVPIDGREPVTERAR